MIREVDISKYWPWVMGNTREFKSALTIAESPELTEAWDGTEFVQRNQYLFESDEYGVVRWEKILNVVPRSGESLDQRKQRIFWIFNTRLPYTIRMLRWYLERVDPDAWPDLDHNRYQLRVLFPNLDMDQIVEQYLFLRQVIPANLGLEGVRFQSVTKTVYAAGLVASRQRLQAPFPVCQPRPATVRVIPVGIQHIRYIYKAGGVMNYAG